MKKEKNMEKLRVNTLLVWRHFCSAILFCATTTIALQAQTFTTLLSFDGSNGGTPTGALFQANDGNFYGTSSYGGPYKGGTAFKMTPAGQLTVLHDFCSKQNCADGTDPLTGMVQATNGLFYGTTYQGGGTNCFCGSIFNMTSSGNLKTLYDWSVNDTGDPTALIEASDGNLYGLTSLGLGEVFKMTRTGTLTVLYNFASGAFPWGLMQAPDSNFYITTSGGGAHDFGAIFKMSLQGKVTALYSFCPTNCADGKYPQAAPVLGNDGNFYGTATEGGANGGGVFFKMTPAGQLTTIYNFCSTATCADGAYPMQLVLGTDGNFYGVTLYGGNNGGGILSGAGTLFKITPAGNLTTLYSFCSQANCMDGANPFATLVQGTDGNFYGSTQYGGTNASACIPGIELGPCGTAFSLSVGLGPFVKLTRDSGKVGGTGGILGQGFTGTTGVFLNGTAASFTVVSDTYIQATVPAGGTSGYVTVQTLSGTLTSNTIFRVEP